MFTIVKNRKATGKIHIAPWAECHEVFAAEELARYIKWISGATIDIVKSLKNFEKNSIVIADLSHPASKSSLDDSFGQNLKLDGHHILTKNGSQYILSKQALGVVFGSYEYLRHAFGCAFYDYGERGICCTKMHTMEHEELDITDNPSCWYRSMQIGVTAEPQEILEKRLDWMAKNGYSHVLVYYGNASPTRVKKGNAKATVDGLFDLEEESTWSEYRKWFIPALKKRGLKLSLGHHCFNVMIDREEYLEEKPEFYPLLNGERRATAQMSWCLSNPDLIATISKRVIDMVRNNPETDVLNLWPNDGEADLCECQSCKKWDRPEDLAVNKEIADLGQSLGRTGRRGDITKSRRYIRFCNEIAAALAEVYPKVKLSIIAYGDLAEPPLTDIKIAPNIIVHLAIYWRCSKHRLNDPSSHLNAQFQLMRDKWLKLLKPENLIFTTYEEGMGCWKGLPWPITALLFDDWEVSRNLGIGGFKTNASTTQMGTYGANYLALSRSTRENPISHEDFVQDYCQHMFNEASEPMQELIILWNKCMHEAESDRVEPSPFEYIRKMFTPERIQQSVLLCDKALTLSNHHLIRWRIERLRSLVFYTQHNTEAPNEIFIKIFRNKEVTNEEMAIAQEWIDQDGEHIFPHMILDDDLISGHQSAGYNKRWLMRVEKEDGEIT